MIIDANHSIPGFYIATVKEINDWIDRYNPSANQLCTLCYLEAIGLGRIEHHKVLSSALEKARDNQ